MPLQPLAHSVPEAEAGALRRDGEMGAIDSARRQRREAAAPPRPGVPGGGSGGPRGGGGGGGGGEGEGEGGGGGGREEPRTQRKGGKGEESCPIRTVNLESVQHDCKLSTL